MPTTTAPPREALVEAIAAVDAAAGVIRQLVGDDDEHAEFSTSSPDVFAWRALAVLRTTSGRQTIRSSWRFKLARTSSKPTRSNVARGTVDRIPVLRARAADYRERGTIDVKFWTGEPGNWS